MSYNIENVGGAYGRPTIAGPPSTGLLPAPYEGRPSTGAYYYDAASEASSISQQIPQGSAVQNGHVDWGAIQGAQLIDVEDELQSDLEVLRQKNLELRAELEILKHSENKGTNIFGSILSTPSVTNVYDTRRLELVWNYLPPVNFHFLWYVSFRGAEHCQLYIWILRDWGWATNRYDVGMVCGGLAVAWAACLLFRAIYNRNIGESWHSFSRLAWQISLFVTVAAALHDSNFPKETKIFDNRSLDASNLLIAAILFQSLYQFILRPFFFPNPNNRGITPYDEPRFHARTTTISIPFLHFDNWRDYERFQIWAWIGKDCAYGYQSQGWWVFFYTITFLLALHLVNVSLNTRRVLIDHCHYAATLMWLVGVFFIEFPNLFLIDGFNHWSFAYPMNRRIDETAPFYAGWILVFSFVPIGVLKIIWIAATELGLIKDDKDELPEEAQIPFEPWQSQRFVVNNHAKIVETSAPAPVTQPKITLTDMAVPPAGLFRPV